MACPSSRPCIHLLRLARRTGFVEVYGVQVSIGAQIVQFVTAWIRGRLDFAVIYKLRRIKRLQHVLENFFSTPTAFLIREPDLTNLALFHPGLGSNHSG